MSMAITKVSSQFIIKFIFYPISNGKPLEKFDQEGDMITFC